MKRSYSSSLSPPPPEILEAAPLASPHKSKKAKLASDYALNTPFPSHRHPTPDECTDVHSILTKAHGARVRRAPDASKNSASTCGSVPNVIDSLIGTILSQNTSGKNSTRAKLDLDAKFGRGEGSFAAIADAPREDVVDAIHHGGLANKKAGVIQGLLHSVYEKHGCYSLQHLGEKTADGHPLSDVEIMQELVTYDGVGPKTAGCVLLFCLGRESFAVDTHVFRLSKLLGWVPAKADRVSAQAHLDLKVPGPLMYGLHVLMITHGKSCSGCKDRGKGSCILKDYLKTKKSVA